MSSPIATSSPAARASWLLVVASQLAATAAGAAPTSQEKAEAEVLFQEGKKLMLQKRYAEACPKLEASQRLDPAGGTLFNLALCHEEEGKLATAWIEFTDALAQAKADKKAERARSAREHIDKLEPRLPRIVVKVASTPSGFKVLRDGAPMSEASFGTPIPVDPGQHKIQATAPDHQPHEQSFSIEVGELKTINLPALTPIAPPSPPSASASTSPPPPPSHDKRRMAGYVAGGVGAAALIVGAVFGLRTLSKKSESDKLCGSGSATTCASEEAIKRNDEAYTSANISNIGIGLGVIGLGVGAYLILSSRPKAPAASWGVTPAFSPHGGGLQAQGRF